MTSVPKDIEILIILFADDIMLMSATIADLQNKLSVLHKHTQRLHLKVTLSKTIVIVFLKGGYLPANRQLVARS